MAKRETGPVAGAPDIGSPPPAAPPQQSPPAPKTHEPSAAVSKPVETEPLVVKWENGRPAGSSKPQTEQVIVSDADAPVETAAPESDQAAAPAEEQATEAEQAATEEKPPAPKEPPKAHKILERLKAEKARQAAEAVAAQERQRAAALEQELARFKGGSIGAKLAALGITTEAQRQELAEAILLGKDIVLPDAAPAEKPVDQRVKELEQRLEAERNEKAAIAAQQMHQQKVGAIVKMTEDMDLGVVRAVEKIVGPRHADGNPAGMNLIAAVAEQMWNEAGRPQNSLAIVRKAAERVAEHYKALYPEVAAANAGTPGPRRPALSQRVAPKPGTNGSKLPSNRLDRDEQIKREFGW